MPSRLNAPSTEERSSRASSGLGGRSSPAMKELPAEPKDQQLMVALRIRPINDTELDEGATIIAHKVGDQMVVLMDPDEDPDDALRANRSREKTFIFDIVFDQQASQEEVYCSTTQHLVEGVISGYNATVFAYGPSGAGKTYTMLGMDSEPGIYLQTLNDLFQAIEETSDDMEYTVSMSYLEVRTHRITITNFCLGKHLVSEDDLLKDQRGSPAYISPDVLSGRPYRGKPSDMWALGVVLFTMLYGQFPFYDSIPQELFRKIKAAEYTIPEDGRVSENTVCLIRKLLVLDPQQRLAAPEVLESLSAIIASWQSVSSLSGPLQVVPDIDDQMNSSDSSQEAKVTEECSQYEFENYMRQQLLLAEEKSTLHEARSFLQKRQFGSVPPVRRLGRDAQPMNPLDAAILAQRYLRK